MGKLLISLPPQPPLFESLLLDLTKYGEELTRSPVDWPVMAVTPVSWDIPPKKPLKPLSPAEIRRLSY